MIFTGGISDWQTLSTIDYPLPAALTIVLGSGSVWTKVFASLGLFGLIASFHGTIIGYSRQIFALAREGYLPRSPQKLTTDMLLPSPGTSVRSCRTLRTTARTTDKIIVLAALGAVAMYIVSLISLFVLRKNEPGLSRPFVVPFYPVFPVIALVLCVVCFAAIIYYNLFISLLFFAGLLLSLAIFKWKGKSIER